MVVSGVLSSRSFAETSIAEKTKMYFINEQSLQQDIKKNEDKYESYGQKTKKIGKMA